MAVIMVSTPSSPIADTELTQPSLSSVADTITSLDCSLESSSAWPLSSRVCMFICWGAEVLPRS